MSVELGIAVAEQGRPARLLPDERLLGGDQHAENAVSGADSTITRIAIDARYARTKRILDIVLVTLALIPAGLIMLLVALAVWYDTPGPIIFRQKRLGMNGVEFEMYKFRSMYHGSSATSHQAATTQFIQGGVINLTDSNMPYKLGNDPRITMVGRFIRKLSLDELPQLFNVLKGDMSIVGPRPPLDYEVALYSQRDMLRLAGKPGLTGTWQVYGRGRVTFQEMVEQDISYLATQSLPYDVKLMFLTVPVLITGQGGA
ncbi:MAG TPA: sugar transferase [Ktedonobacterales bacterium]|nr:sugar transferase [Ktedonobacterales bacterium]